jgi:hypothetical protein
MKTNLFAILSLAAALSAHAASFNYPDFSSTAGVTLTGNAAQNGSFVRLTPSTTVQYGAMWYNTPQYVIGGFTTTFQFRMSQQGGIGGGGDGIAFALQNVGNHAAGMEYGAFSNNIGITLNTFQTAGEPSANFVGIVTNTDAAGNASYKSTYNLNTINLKDGNIHSATLNYGGGNLSMLIDGVSVFSNVPLDLSHGTDLSGNSFIGFGARCGLATENHDILSWSFTNVPEPSSAAILTVGGVVFGRRLFRRKNRTNSLRC